MSDKGRERRRWTDRFFQWLLGEDADWVLGDLEERSRKRRGPARWAGWLRDVVSVSAWALLRRRTGTREGTMSGMGRSGFADSVRQDVSYTVAALRRDLGFTVVVILTLAIGIGSNTAVFSVIDSVLLRPLPYAEPDRLVTLWTSIAERGITESPSAYGNVQDWRDQSDVFEDLATYDPSTRTLTDGEWPERISTADVSWNLFSVLGAEPALGRGFSEDEERRRAAVVVLSHDLWLRRFAASPSAIGQTIEIDRRSFEIIGVMPEGFAYPEMTTQLWVPQTVLSGWDGRAARRGTDSWRVLARLRPGVSLESARAEMADIAERLERDHPTENAGLGIAVERLQDQLTGSSLRRTLWVLYGSVVFVLLITCANAAHLIVVRGFKRAHEISLRAALGATTSRLVRLTLTETILVSVLAGAAGLALARLGIDLLVAIAPADISRLGDARMNLHVLAYGMATALISGGLAGIWPSVSRSRRAPYETLRQGPGTDRSRGWGRQLLVVAQFALAIVLVFGTTLLVRSFTAARSVEVGFETSGILMANLRVGSSSDRVAVYRQVVQSVGSLPGVNAVSLVEDLFISGAPSQAVETEQGDAAEPIPQELRIDAIDGPFFRTLGISILEGRDFTPADDAGAVPVAIINETMAGRLWPGRSPVGRRFRTPGSPWIEVVGVVANMRRQGFEREPIAQAFRPYAQSPSGGMNILVRTDGAVPGLAAAIRTTVAAIDRTVPMYFVTTVDEALDRYLGPRRFQVVLLGLFSTVALLLAAIGIYGLVQYSVSRRTREVGIRMAVGAQSTELLRMVLVEGLTPATLGLAVGMASAFILSRAISPLLFDVRPSDPTTIVVTAAVLLSAATVACFIPARRAARVDPVTALREP